MRRRNFLQLTAGAAAMPLAPRIARAQQPFYKGRRLTLLINFAPGGSTDIEGRLFAHHIGRHIEGQPNIVIQNMEGAGGFTGAAYLGGVAPRDGSVFGYLAGTSWQFVTDPNRFRVDLREHEFVCYLPGTVVYYARTDLKPGMTEATDIVKAQGVVAGGNSAQSARDLLIRLTLDILGVPFRYVTGYRSGNTARLAFQRNEISFYAEPAPAYRGAVERTLVKDGVAKPLYFDPTYDGHSLTVSKQVDGLPLLPFHEFYKAIHGDAMPRGELWEMYLACLALTTAMGRMIVFPPGAPPEAIAALRAAVLRLSEDKVFHEDALKRVGYIPEYVTGPDVDQKARAMLQISPQVKAFVADYIKKGATR